jgi:outer membrane receptor protein involved in Fe transport
MIGLTAVPPTYSSDSLWSYEIGSKNSLADNRVLLNASAYYIKWKNIQQNVPLTACGFQYTGNLADARSTGFDLQTIANLTKVLSVGANFSYIDAQYTETVQLAPGVFSIVQDGDRLPASPWSVSAFAQATVPLSGAKAYARVDYQYSAKQNGTVAAANPLNGGFPAGFDAIPSQSFTSLRTGLNWGGWDVSLYAQNLFDTHPRLGGAMEILAPYSLYTAYSYRPRTVGLTGTYHY